MEFVESIFLASFSRKQGQLLCAGERNSRQQTQTGEIKYVSQFAHRLLLTTYIS